MHTSGGLHRLTRIRDRIQAEHELLGHRLATFLNQNILEDFPWPGAGSLFSNSQGLYPSGDGNWNYFKAPTDGFVIGVIAAPDSSSDGCMCWADAQTNGVIWRITGGNVGFFGADWDHCMAHNPNSLTMPVQVGADFSICSWQGSDNQQSNASVYWYWIPIGVGQAQSTPEAIAKPGSNFVSVPPPKMTVKRERNVDDFIEALEELSGKTIDDRLKKKLLSGL